MPTIQCPLCKYENSVRMSLGELESRIVKCPSCKQEFTPEDDFLLPCEQEFTPVGSKTTAKVTKSFMGKSSIRYDCPKCNTGLRNPIEEAGEPDVCPECNSDVIVPFLSAPTGEDKKSSFWQKKERKTPPETLTFDKNNLTFKQVCQVCAAIVFVGCIWAGIGWQTLWDQENRKEEKEPHAVIQSRQAAQRELAQRERGGLKHEIHIREGEVWKRDTVQRGRLTYMVNNEIPYTGRVLGIYTNQQKGFEGAYKDGKETGTHTEWLRNGQKSESVAYKDGKKNGTCTEWHENGQKRFEGTYKDGKKNGTCTEWHENGRKRFEGAYKDGELHGKSVKWHENGQKSESVAYKDGKETGTHTSWHENGQKLSEKTYRDGKETGTFTRWHENGQKRFEGTYKDGKLDGKGTVWHENGQILWQPVYVDGVEQKY